MLDAPPGIVQDAFEDAIAVSFQITRNSYPSPARCPRRAAPTTGIDYLALIDEQHSTEIAQKMTYAVLDCRH